MTLTATKIDSSKQQNLDHRFYDLFFFLMRRNFRTMVKLINITATITPKTTLTGLKYVFCAGLEKVNFGQFIRETFNERVHKICITDMYRRR
jgi:hypothetical protein